MASIEACAHVRKEVSWTQRGTYSSQRKLLEIELHIAMLLDDSQDLECFCSDLEPDQSVVSEHCLAFSLRVRSDLLFITD